MKQKLIVFSTSAFINLLFVFVTFAQSPEIIKDINSNSLSLNPQQGALLGGFVYYAATDSTHGTELWRTDGTSVGTTMVKDIQAGIDSSGPLNLKTIGGVIYFSAKTSAGGVELWKTDGTALGTVQVKDINSGTGGSFPNKFFELDPSTILFIASDGTTGSELWKTDGTSSGTQIVKDINSATPSSMILSFAGDFFSKVGTKAVFFATTAANGSEPWVTDGTTGGTSLLADIKPGLSSSTSATISKVLGGYVYFSADDGVNGQELWRTDGTSLGTTLFADIVLGATGSFPFELTTIGSKIYFSASDLVNGVEPWTTDGTLLGTTILKNIAPSAENSVPANFTAVGANVFFTASISSSLDTGDTELYKTDGTTLGTLKIKDINPGTASSNPANLFVLGTKLIFAATNPENGLELWVSDGSDSGTLMLKDLTPGVSSGYSNSVTPQLLGANALVLGKDQNLISNFYFTDGTANGTILATAAVDTSATANSGPFGFKFANGNNVFFFATNNQTGTELYFSDGTLAGTNIVKDLNPGSNSSGSGNLDYYAVLSGKFIGNLSDGVTGSELWISDGTASGTSLIKDIRSGSGGSFPYNFIQIGSITYFTADDGVSGAELWKTDGTEAGTVLVKDIKSGFFGSGISVVTAFNGGFVFVADDGSGREMWFSDGTTAGTNKIKDINSTTASASSDPILYTLSGGKIFFRANDGINGAELWVSEGTASGTIMVKDINSSGTSSISEIYPFNGGIVFSANDNTGVGTELWFSDGTAAGTSMIKDINTGSGSSFPYQFQNFSGFVYFIAIDSTNTVGLWKTDGTNAGTLQVKNFTPNPDPDAEPNYEIFAFDSKLYITAPDGSPGSDGSGSQLYVSDGTAAGTSIFLKPNVTGATANPSGLTANDELMYFQASDPAIGSELWAAKLPRCTFNSALLLKNCPYTSEFGSKVLALVKLVKKLKIPTTPKAVKKMKLLKKDIKTALGDMQSFAKTYSASINMDAGANLTNLVSGAARKIKAALKQAASTFSADKKTAVKSLNTLNTKLNL